MKLVFLLVAIYLNIVHSVVVNPVGDILNQVFDPTNEGFTQELYGISGAYGGVAFAANGDPVSMDCSSPGLNQLWQYDQSTTVPMHGSNIHPSAVHDVGATLGCGLSNHPDGRIYGNNFINGIDAGSFAHVYGPAGTGGGLYGISVDPQTNILYYRSNANTISRIDPLTSINQVFVVTSAFFIDGIYWNCAGTFLYLADLSGSRLFEVDRAGVVTHIINVGHPPDGLAFHYVSGDIFTANSDGTISRVHIGDGSYAVTVFGAGGFRFDLGHVGKDSCWYVTSDHSRFADGTVTGDRSLVRICGGFCPPPGVPDMVDCATSGKYRTQSEGDMGDKCSEGFQTGCYRDANFDECFGNGVTVGCPSKYTIHLDSSAAVENYLPQLGAPAPLDQSYVNPSNPPPISTSSGNFGGQITALALSLGFEACDPNWHHGCGSLKDLYICDDRCAKCKRNNNCKRNSNDCKNLRDEDDEFVEEERNNKNNGPTGKPKYANCEKFFGSQVKDIFNAANQLLGGCSNCPANGAIERNKANGNCVRNNKCRKSEEARNNKNCNRNKSCKKAGNCCCCADQSDSGAPECDAALLNACVTMINQAFIFEKSLDEVGGGTLFSTKPCPCANGFEWIATVNGETYPLNPFFFNGTMSTYYGYGVGDGASANTPDGLEDTNSNKVLVEFVEDGNGNNNLLVIYDTPNDAEGGSAASSITHNGNLNAASFIVQDDVGEGFSAAPGVFHTNNNWAPCCTDGYILGVIPKFACFTYQLAATTGVSSLRLASKGAVDGTAVEIPKSDSGTITVDICNRCKK